MTENITSSDKTFTDWNGKPLYKVLMNGVSFHGGDFTYSLPTPNEDGTYTPGDWHELDDAIEVQVCRNGFHLTDNPRVWWDHGATAYVAEGAGDFDDLEFENEQKIAFRRVRLLRPVEQPAWIKDVLATVERWKSWSNTPDGQPDENWVLFDDYDAMNETLLAMPKIRWGRPLRWNEKFTRVYGNTLDRVNNLTADGVLDWQWKYAESTCHHALAGMDNQFKQDAKLYLLVEVVGKDLDIPEADREFARQRLRVWEKGYWLGGNLDGKLYVCKRDRA